jgi:hypothetical protein
LELKEDAKRKLLRENAVELFRLEMRKPEEEKSSLGIRVHP